MSFKPTRRTFLSTGLAFPAAGVSMSRLSNSHPIESSSTAEKPELKYRELGDTGIKITSVGFGCMLTSDPTVIERAADIGINFFDTARGYQNGNNERMVGSVLKSRRSSVLICTKSGAEDALELQEELDTSLTELGTDYIDIWYLHGKSDITEITEGHIEVVEKARKEGKIRFAGVSTHKNQAALLTDLAGNSHIDVVLAAYNFTMGPEVAEAVAAVRKAGKAVVGMKVMAGGFRRRKPGDELYDKLNQEGAMLAALKWVLNDKNVGTAIPSITDMDQLDQNLKAMSLEFDENDKRLLARQLDFIQPMYCRMCGACEGKCPNGVPVSDILRHLSYLEGYGQFVLARESFLQLPQFVRDVRCSQCPECVISCPNGVMVSERLIRAQELLA